MRWLAIALLATGCHDGQPAPSTSTQRGSASMVATSVDAAPADAAPPAPPDAVSPAPPDAAPSAHVGTPKERADFVQSFNQVQNKVEIALGTPDTTVLVRVPACDVVKLRRLDQISNGNFQYVGFQRLACDGGTATLDLVAR